MEEVQDPIPTTTEDTDCESIKRRTQTPVVRWETVEQMGRGPVREVGVPYLNH